MLVRLASAIGLINTHSGLANTVAESRSPSEMLNPAKDGGAQLCCMAPQSKVLEGLQWTH